jgi:hypothetical protein
VQKRAKVRTGVLLSILGLQTKTVSAADFGETEWEITYHRFVDDGLVAFPAWAQRLLGQ